MRNKIIILLVGILTILGNTVEARRTTRAGSRGGRSAIRTATGNPTTPINYAGTAGENLILKSDTGTSTTTGFTTAAPTNDKLADRRCTQLVVKQLKSYCDTQKNVCRNPTEIYALMEFPTVTEAPTSANDVYCQNFLESAVTRLWDSYDDVDIKGEENCEIALARAFAAEECYVYTMTNVNSKPLAYKDELEDLCGLGAIQDQYVRISKVYPTTKTLPTDFGSTLHEHFEKVGNIGLSDLMAYPGRALDLKIDWKTSAFPRELVQIVNTLKSQGNVMCGSERYTTLYDADFPLEIKTSSWQKAVADKGLLKGSSDFIADQVSVVFGTDVTDDYKKKGLLNLGKVGKTDKAKETETEETETITKAVALTNLNNARRTAIIAIISTNPPTMLLQDGKTASGFANAIIPETFGAENDIDWDTANTLITEYFTINDTITTIPGVSDFNSVYSNPAVTEAYNAYSAASTATE